MFLAKKILGPFLSPMSIVLVMGLMGLLLLWLTRKQKTGKVLVTVAFGFLGLLSYDQISDFLVGPLEQEYAPIMDTESVQGVEWIVVLGGGSAVDTALPSSTYLSEASLKRLAEGVSIQKRIPGSKLIVTGSSGWENQRSAVRDQRSEGKGQDPKEVAEVMADVAKEWGVRPEDIVVEAEAKDTEDHAVFVKEIVGKDRFIVVTSASHMPRAMGLFRARGMEPIPAPTDYMVSEREGGLRPGDFFPSAGALEEAERALHEYLGMVWARLRGKTGIR